MGVPSYFAWWAKRYAENIIRRSLPFKDFVLYLDFNGGIHPAVRNDPMMTYDNMNAAVCTYLEAIIAYTKPREVWIAVDGVAPIAKLSQQRDRRFKSVKESKAKREIALDNQQQIRSERIDFNMISPGTEFMSDLEEELVAFLEIMKKGKWRDIKFTISGSGIPGEGEHKIMNEIRQRDAQGIKEHCCIYGLDADLIFLSMENAPNAFLVRENVQFSGRDDIGLDKDTYPYIYLDIFELREHVLKFLDPAFSLHDLSRAKFKFRKELSDYQGKFNIDHYDPGHDGDKIRLIRDYIYICFLLGNDFIPRLPCLKIRNGSLNDIIVIYKRVSWLLGDYLIYPDLTVNREFLNYMLADIAHMEDDLMKALRSQRLSDINRFQERNKYLPKYKRELAEFDYVENQYIDTIRGGSPGWRHRYYDYNFGLRYRHPREFQRALIPICEDYLRGMHWVLKYYTGYNNNWSWSYDYDAAPTALDLFSTLPDIDVNYEFEDTRPVQPFVQLLSILPPDSAHLLPSALRPLMTDGNSPIHFMYPLKITLSLIGNKFLHECKPKMPHVDHALLRDVVSAKYKYLTDKEKERNTLSKEKRL